MCFRLSKSHWRCSGSRIPHGMNVPRVWSLHVDTDGFPARPFGKASRKPGAKMEDGDKDPRVRTSDLQMRFVVQLPPSVLQKALWWLSDSCHTGNRRRVDIDISLRARFLAGWPWSQCCSTSRRCGDYMGIQLLEWAICPLDRARRGEVSPRSSTVSLWSRSDARDAGDGSTQTHESSNLTQDFVRTDLE
jgi:hypothetical protein